jgi:hypothetical protein
VGFNRRVHLTVEDLNQRLARIESGRPSPLQGAFTSPNEGRHTQRAPAIHPTLEFRGIDDGRSRSPSPDHDDYRERNDKRGASGMAKTRAEGDRKGRRGLQIQIPVPGRVLTGLPIAGLPTPISGDMVGSTLQAEGKAKWLGCYLSFHSTLTQAQGMAMSMKTPKTPRTPLTPGRIGPPEGTKKTATCISKRSTHNVNDMVPPVYVQMPLLPVTDSELIVYFFQSLSRPIVSLRLYARRWGPAAISDTLNEHRDIHPPYLRNTMSVKCTTALKKGRTLYGEDWENTYRPMFANENTSNEASQDEAYLRPIRTN